MVFSGESVCTALGSRLSGSTQLGETRKMQNSTPWIVVGMSLSFFGSSVAYAQEVTPSCDGCPSTYVSAEEIAEYGTVSAVDQRIRTVDIGKANVNIALVQRGRLEEPGGAAEHSLVTEVYYILSGSGINVTGPDLIAPVPRDPSSRVVRELNGPGHNASGIRNGVTHDLKAGDVFVIPAGTGHQFVRIDDHIRYIMVRLDPDKVVPSFDEAASRAYLEDQR